MADFGSLGEIIPVFRTITAVEVTAAYELYSMVCGWLQSKGVRQWLVPLAIEEFTRRQERSELWGCFSDKGLVATVTLSHESALEWQAEIGGQDRWWMKTLVVERGSARVKIGEAVIRECESVVAARGGSQMWLDCVDGFLSEYYRGLGYLAHASKTITYPSGNSYGMVLMSHQTPNQISEVSKQAGD